MRSCTDTDWEGSPLTWMFGREGEQACGGKTSCPDPWHLWTVPERWDCAPLRSIMRVVAFLGPSGGK